MLRLLHICAALLCYSVVILAHMEVINPCPRYNANGVNCPQLPPGETLDWNTNAPIASNMVKLQPICKHATPWPTPAAYWKAGTPVFVEFSTHGSPHDGGHCEWSLSYDHGQTFVVVHRKLSYCFYSDENQLVTNYTFTLPADVPNSDSAILMWSWVNAMGNREFYTNCADIAISGSTSASFTGPQVTILNYPGYPEIPEFLGNYSVGLSYYENAPLITVPTASESDAYQSAI
ncbi:hypothetical protein BX667DRAFT_507203 [Coemansia mojavensis]|nr:hypothetical protein BX667DRAFT_507203 [Coemansia mojavensis]